MARQPVTCKKVLRMNNHTVIRDELLKAMTFYRELGFEFLPSKEEVIHTLIAGITTKNEKGSEPCNQVAESPGAYMVNKKQALDALRDEIGDCQRCRLSNGRKNIVFGEGSVDADIMFVGEGPGRDEDIQARPFVGTAGKLLTNLIVKLGIKRDEVYIANIVKCRPPGNRNPEEDEISTCIPFVARQIEIIQPRVIVCLGRIAAQALLKTGKPISRLRGDFLDFNGIAVMPTFHPAYLLRNPKDKWLTWEDMQKVLEKLKNIAEQ